MSSHIQSRGNFNSKAQSLKPSASNVNTNGHNSNSFTVLPISNHSFNNNSNADQNPQTAVNHTSPGTAEQAYGYPTDQNSLQIKTLPSGSLAAGHHPDTQTSQQPPSEDYSRRLSNPAKSSQAHGAPATLHPAMAPGTENSATTNTMTVVDLENE